MSIAINQELIKADIFRVLSRGFSYPDEENLQAIKEIITDLLHAEGVEEKEKELLKNILLSVQPDEIKVEYSRLFLKGNVPVTETSLCAKMDAIADVSGFYNAFGITPRTGDSPDAISYELEFLSVLYVKKAIAEKQEQESIVTDAIQKFRQEHFVDFAKKFHQKLHEIVAVDFYKHMNDLLLMQTV